MSVEGASHVITVEELDVFRLSHLLCLEIFKITKTLTEEEKFGLIIGRILRTKLSDGHG